jgi:peptidoglycan/xylan/chitin deacetylase (PgdA/CDA1 family)
VADPASGMHSRRGVVTVSGAVLAIPVVAGICAWSACHPRAQVFGPTRRRASRHRTLALTFDDGPNPAVTPRLLDTLDRYDARATFFVIGRYVRACPGLAREIADRGHSVGNHTDTHPNLLWLSRAQVLDELLRCGDSILQATGQRTAIMRPPYGYRGPHVHAAARQAGLDPPIMWSKTARDWTPQPVAQLIRRLQTVQTGDIVLMHDGSHHALGAKRDETVQALEHWLPRWQAEGLELVPLDPDDAALKQSGGCTD